MKLYTDITGKFQMFIPVEWEFKNPTFYKNQNTPNAFGQYDNTVGAFQISCKPINQHISELIKGKDLTIQKSEEQLQFTEDIAQTKKFHTYLWMCAVDDHFILITYIFDSKISKRKSTINELSSVRKTIASLKFIKPQYRDIILSQRRYGLFISSMAASIDLRNKALENGSFIELVILIANRIDGLLRLSIILTNQLENNNSEIDSSILYQSEDDKPLMERQIYKISFERKIIDKKLYDELELLYKERNKVVHRYIITDIRTEDVLNIAKEYSEIEDKVDKIISELEIRQYTLKVGINNGDLRPGEKLDSLEMKKLLTSVRDKHGRIKWKQKDE
jgi:hypothetical protein